MPQFKDQLNRTISLPNPPKRIVSLVPSQTELLVDLGLIDKIFGVTKFCVHPKGLKKEKTVIGGTKNFHFDKIELLSSDKDTNIEIKPLYLINRGFFNAY